MATLCIAQVAFGFEPKGKPIVVAFDLPHTSSDGGRSSEHKLPGDRRADPLHPTGQALCPKGRAAPELVYHADRLRHPLKRTRPKGDPNPGWQRISWDEALDVTAVNLRRLAEQHGPHSVVFSMVSASTSALADSAPWIQRLMRAFGSPNLCGSMELCRGLPSLRRRARDPEVEVHPAAAAERGIHAGDWVTVETPEGRIRARARLNESLEPGVVCGQHGWWQGCPEIGAPGYDPFGPDGANFNLIIGNAAMDPVSGSVPHRAYLCEIRRAE